MEVLNEVCAGLDVHRSKIAVCAVRTGANGKTAKVRAEFGTTAPELAKLAAWLKKQEVTAVCMESTGVYWMPVFAALENAGGFDLWVVNAQHVKAVPGRKTDVKDAEWLAHLLRHGLLKKSFVPAKPFREPRDLTRYRRVSTEAQASERQRPIRLLKLADIKLAGVMSDVFGVSGRAILKAIIEGGHTASDMAKLARGTLRKKRPQPIDALSAEMPAHQRQLLGIQLGRVEAAEAEIAALDKEIGKRLEPCMGLFLSSSQFWLLFLLLLFTASMDFPANRRGNPPSQRGAWPRYSLVSGSLSRGPP